MIYYLLFFYLFVLLFDYIIEKCIHRPQYISQNEFNNLDIHEKLVILEIDNKSKTIIPFIFSFTQKKNIIPMLIIEPIDQKNKITHSKCIIFSHGNKTNIYKLRNYLQNMANSLNMMVISYDYIGYGFSNYYNPSEEKCYASLDTVINYVNNNLNIANNNIYLIGRSLGTGIVIDYLSKNPWTNKVMLISPYKSIITTKFNTKFILPFDKFKSITKIKKIKCPIKIFHGNNDKIINISHGKELFDLLPNKEILPTWLPGVGHSDILNKIEIDDYIKFINI